MRSARAPNRWRGNGRRSLPVPDRLVRDAAVLRANGHSASQLAGERRISPLEAASTSAGACALRTASRAFLVPSEPVSNPQTIALTGRLPLLPSQARAWLPALKAPGGTDVGTDTSVCPASSGGTREQAERGMGERAASRICAWHPSACEEEARKDRAREEGMATVVNRAGAMADPAGISFFGAGTETRASGSASSPRHSAMPAQQSARLSRLSRASRRRRSNRGAEAARGSWAAPVGRIIETIMHPVSMIRNRPQSFARIVDDRETKMPARQDQACGQRPAQNGHG